MSFAQGSRQTHGNNTHNTNSSGQRTNMRNHEQAHLMEAENNRMIDDLSDQVGLLKNLTMRIQKDIREHDVLIGEMDKGFDSTGALLGAAMKKLTNLMNSGGANYFLMLTGFIFFLFISMYLFLRK